MTNPILEVLTASEAEILWDLKPGTVRRACRENRIEARLSSGTWLTTKIAMTNKYGNKNEQHKKTTK